MTKMTDDEPKQMAAITANLQAARDHLQQLHQAMATLEAQGMYDAAPTESWQDRNGSGQYLYLYFPQGAHGFLGPDGKRKVYIGCDPARIAEARRLAGNRKRYDQLARVARELVTWIAQRGVELAALARQSAHWPTGEGMQP